MSTISVRAEDVCLPIWVQVEQTTFKIDVLWVLIAFLIGLIVGTLLALLCGRLCVRDYARSKLQLVDTGTLVEEGKSTVVLKKYEPTTQSEYNRGRTRKKFKAKVSKKGRAKTAGKKGRKGSETEPLVPIQPIVLSAGEDEEQPSRYKGMTDALIKTNQGAMEAELSNQDLESVEELETELREENMNNMVQMLRVMLNKEMMKGKLSEDQYKDQVQTFQNNVSNILKTADTDQEEEEEELRRKHAKNPALLEKEMEKLHPKYIQRVNSQLQDEKERFRQELIKNSNLTEAEVDSLMAKYAAQMADLEKRQAMERERQAAALEERLARRRAQAEMHNMKKEEQMKEIQYRHDAHDKTLTSLVEDGKLLDRQREEILNQYEDDLNHIQMQHNEQLQRQQLHLAEKLRHKREKRMKSLAEEQDREKEEFLQKSDKMTDTAELSKAYHKLLHQQRKEKDEIIEGFDQKEVDEFKKLQKEMDAERASTIQNQETHLEETLQRKAQLSEKDANRILQIHEKEMEHFESMKKSQRKRQQAILQEKLEQKRLKAEEESSRILAEQDALKEQQDATMNKVLGATLDLDEEARLKIMKEHEQHMAAVNNQLAMSKLRQQKALEQKLASRRARVSDLKEQQEQARLSIREGKAKEKEKLQQKLQKQIEEEEQKLQQDRKNMINELRERLAAETEEALKEQERQIGLLIGRLQVGQARRQTLIQKQDKTIQELEEQITSKVGEDPAINNKDREVDYVLQRHNNQVAHLNDKLQENRNHQEAILQEKLQRKRLKKEREIEDKLESEAQDDWADNKKRGAGLATSILRQVLLENQHKMAMEQLEHEMQIEMQRQREELNKELEEAMQVELEEQKKSFLAQLAAIANISKQELNEVVNNAVHDTGGSDKQAKLLAKELKQEMLKAKTTFGMDEEPTDNRYHSKSRGRATPDGDEDGNDDDDDDDESDNYYNKRLNSSLKTRPKSAYRNYKH